MGRKVRIIEEARENYKRLDDAIREQVLAGICKASQAPLPSPYGCGKSLGNRSRNDLTGFFKVKYRRAGIRVVYTLSIDEMVMNIVVISEHDDSYCYNLASVLYEKYGKELFADISEGFDSGEQNGKQ